MKRLWILLASILLATASIPFQGWAQTNAGVVLSENLLPDSLRDNVLDLYADTNGDILAAMSKKALLRSKDNGKSWERIFNKDFLSNFGWAVIRETKTNALLYACGSGIFRSTDEGANWTRALQDDPIGRCFLEIPGGSILAGVTQSVLRSDDGGVTWRTVFTNAAKYFNVYALARNPKTGALFAGVTDTLGLGVLRSTDGGATWRPSNTGLGDLHVPALAADENGVIYAGVEKKGLHRSTDDGVTWEKVPGFNAFSRNSTAILVLKPNLIFASFGWLGGGDPSGKGGVFKYDGRVWTQIIADSILVMSLEVKNNSLLVGTRNAIYRVDGVITGVEEEETIPPSFALHQNYPNPFNPSTTISFSLPERSYVRLTVYNMLGQEVATLVAEEMSAGTHRIAWDASHLPSGVYFARLESQSIDVRRQYIGVKRMVLLR